MFTFLFAIKVIQRQRRYIICDNAYVLSDFKLVNLAI